MNTLAECLDENKNILDKEEYASSDYDHEIFNLIENISRYFENNPFPQSLPPFR